MLKQILHTILVPFVFTNAWLISSINLKFKGGDENFSFWTIHETGGKFAFQLAKKISAIQLYECIAG